MTAYTYQQLLNVADRISEALRAIQGLTMTDHDGIVRARVAVNADLRPMLRECIAEEEA